MSVFTFQWPWMLGLLLVIPFIAILLRRAQQKRNDLRKTMGHGPDSRGGMRDRLRILSLVFLIVALARPGFMPERHAISQNGRDVIFAIDVSQSMLARDAIPSRLESAKQGVRDALDQFDSERVALVIYAGSTSILCPLTFDYDFIRFMLDQVTPRTVDFGGTTLLSAVQKTADNILLTGREGMQDLVVLTDGENHEMHADKIIEILKEKELDLLIVGIGDKHSGARIPVEDDDGHLTYLKYKNQEIYTKLMEDDLLPIVSPLSLSEYYEAGTQAFDLASVYSDYAAGKSVSNSNGNDTFIVYREGAFFLILFAIILIFFTEKLLGQFVLLLLLGLIPFPSHSFAQSTEKKSFDMALQLQAESQFEEAVESYETIRYERSDVLTLSQQAVLEFNAGLCEIELARQTSQENPEISLNYVKRAKHRFLAAKRMNPRLNRAGIRLELANELILHLEEVVKQQQEQDQAAQEQLQLLIEQLQALKEQQENLRHQIHAKDPKVYRSKKNSKQIPIVSPTDQDIKTFESLQKHCLNEGTRILKELQRLNRFMKPPELDSEPVKSFLDDPVLWMQEASVFQESAHELIALWQSWNLARSKQQSAEGKIQDILDVLANDQSSESEDGDWEDEDWDMEDYEEGESGNPSSMKMEGEMASNSQMQPLPVPNYSSEDLLMEEQSHMQFRQEQREKSQAGRVEKDW